MTDFHFTPGDSPLLISVPHAGTAVPDDVAERLTDRAAQLPDTDWFVDRLYAFATDLGAGLLVAHWSRYVIDLNRPPDDSALYGRRTTGLVPTETFDGHALYRDVGPDERERAARVERYWRPYHDALDSELGRLKARHGHAVLLDAHSIRSEVPALFEGVLPHFNLGTNGGDSADPGLAARAMEALSGAPDYETVRDERFRGGHITRNSGRPADGRHALQLEMAQRAYMEEQPPALCPDRQAAVTGVLRRFLAVLRDWRPA